MKNIEDLFLEGKVNADNVNPVYEKESENQLIIWNAKDDLKKIGIDVPLDSVFCMLVDKNMKNDKNYFEALKEYGSIKKISDLYPHPYFPGQTPVSFTVLKSIPWMKKGQILEVKTQKIEDGIDLYYVEIESVISKEWILELRIEELYEEPTFFKPNYV